MTKINLKSLYGDDARYIGEGSAAALESLDESHLTALNEALEELNGEGVLGIDCNVSVTHETLADFDDARTKHWSDRGSARRFAFAGRPAVEFDRFQLFRGQPRRKMIIVDLGDIRVCLT